MKAKKKNWKRGRKPFTEEAIVRKQIKISESQNAWLQTHGNASAIVRALIDHARENNTQFVMGS